MFNVDEFQDNFFLENAIIKLNKLLDKDKSVKALKIINELEGMLESPDLTVPISYILSIIAENKIQLISNNLIKKLIPFLHSKDIKLRTNSIIVIGFYCLSNPNYIEKYSHEFANLLVEKSDKDIRNNGHYFLQEFDKISPGFITAYKETLLKAFLIENSDENILSLLNFLEKCKDLDFKQLLKFRKISKVLISKYYDNTSSEIFTILESLIKKFFPSLNDIDFMTYKENDLIDLLSDLFLMKAYDFSKISKEKNIRFNDFIKQIKKTLLKDKEIFFYIKNKEKKTLYIYELEKKKFIKFFEINNKISLEKIKEKFSPILHEKEVKNFLNTLIKIGHINGYLSKFYFYPVSYLKNEILNKFQQKGIVNLKNYNFLPHNFVYNIIEKATKETNREFLLGKNKKAYYSLKNIQYQINSVAAKNNSLDLIAYRERLTTEDFIKLVKNLPKEYLTNFRKGTHWLTNIGKTKIKKEIDNSKIIGFFDIKKISEKLKIRKILLMDVLELYVDSRSGIWDKSKEIFYYSKFLKEKIDKIDKFLEKEEMNRIIDNLAITLNIDKNHILTKIDENYKLIGEEIKASDKIKISEYLEKTGMEHDIFIKFIEDLELNYLIQGDRLILNPKKIKDAKNKIKNNLIEKSKSLNYITIGNFDIKSDIVKDLIKGLQEDTKLKGIFHEEGGEMKFYTARGIEEMIMENSFAFSFHDLFYGKELSDNEIQIIREVFDNLINSKKIMGDFNEKTLSFSSQDFLFTMDYNSNLSEFEKMINNYFQIFDKEFQKIRKILRKRNEIIFPQEIKIIQEIIDKINTHYVAWSHNLEGFIHNANRALLREQGYTRSKYDSLPIQKKKEINLFEEDIEVYENMNNFKEWTKLFNDIENKYGTLIFFQKKLLKDPDNKEIEQNLKDLLENLNIT